VEKLAELIRPFDGLRDLRLRDLRLRGFQLDDRERAGGGNS
jgi:hypothetical protein